VGLGATREAWEDKKGAWGDKKEGIGVRWGRIVPCFARENKKKGLPGHEGSLV